MKKSMMEKLVVLVKSINDMTDELNAMEKMRQEFVSNVSHEIQSPLIIYKRIC